MQLLNPKLSNEIKTIIKNKIGYRNDYLFDGDDFLIMDVIAHEEKELGNTDITEFIKSQYNIKPKNIKPWLESNFNIKVDKLYGYWLAPKSGIDLYIDFPETDLITEIKLPKEYIVLSDLKCDGCLIVSPTPKSELTENAKQYTINELIIP